MKSDDLSASRTQRTARRANREATKAATNRAAKLAASAGLRTSILPEGGEELVLTIDETARILRLSRQSAYEAARRGEIPVLRIGRRLLVPRVALEALLVSSAEGSPALERNGKAIT